MMEIIVTELHNTSSCSPILVFLHSTLRFGQWNDSTLHIYILAIWLYCEWVLRFSFAWSHLILLCATGGLQPRATQHRKSAALTSFRALYPFTARNQDELSFDADDVIEVCKLREPVVPLVRLEWFQRKDYSCGSVPHSQHEQPCCCQDEKRLFHCVVISQM